MFLVFIDEFVDILASFGIIVKAFVDDFTALHALHVTRTTDEKAVCPPVCLSVCQTFRLLYYTKDHLAQFSEKNGWWGATPST